MPISRTAIVDDDGTGTTGTVLGNAWKQEIYDQIDAALAPVEAITVVTGTCQGRLTLTSGTPVTTSDVTGASSIYFTPYSGNRIALYSGSAWSQVTFSELTLALGTVVTGQAYDVFAYLSSGVAAVEALEWKHATVTMTIATPCVVTWTGHGLTTGQQVTFTSTGSLPTGVTANTVYYLTTIDANTFKLSTSPANLSAGTFVASSGSQSGTHTGHNPQARQTALTTQDGVLSKTGDTTRRYLGTFYTTSTTTTEDSFLKRCLWNYNNRVRRAMRTDFLATASWTYASANWRQTNASASNQVAWILGVEEAPIDLAVGIAAANPSANILLGSSFGLDTIANVSDYAQNPTFYSQVTNVSVANYSPGRVYGGIGFHYAAWIEYSGSGTTTFTGTAVHSGITATIEG